MTNSKRTGRPPTDPAVRFDRQVDFGGPVPAALTTPCWLWLGANTGHGYAQFTTGGRHEPKSHLVHRWNYERYVGEIPDGWQVDHLCKVRHCVNPDHLEAVPAGVNNDRSDSPSARNARMVLCKYGLHVLAGDNLSPAFLKRGERRCQECKRERQREYRARKRLEQI